MRTIAPLLDSLKRDGSLLSVARYARWWMAFLLILADIISLVISMGLAIRLRHVWLGGVGEGGKLRAMKIVVGRRWRLSILRTLLWL